MESEYKDSRLLILGGTGFIGKHLAEGGVERGCEVTCVSLNSGSQLNEAQTLPGKPRLVTLDLRNQEEVRSFFESERFHYIINCSGYIDHRLYSNCGRGVIDQHLTALMNVLDVLNRDELKCFLQIGSSDEYGSLPAPQKEMNRESPISPYSFAKSAAAQLLQMMHRTENFPAVIVRIFLTYGPGQDSKRFLPQIIQGCLRGREFPVSSGEQLRDFCYVKDIVNGIFKCMVTLEAQGEIFNLASGKPVTIRHMIETVRESIGAGKPLFGKVPYRPGENMELYADVKKATDILNWVPATDLETGLKNTIEYYRKSAI